LFLIATTGILLTYKVTAQGSGERCHAAAAIEYLDKGTYTLDPVHPPLSRIAIGIPLYLGGERFPHWPANVANIGLQAAYSGESCLIRASLCLQWIFAPR
jgi:hypothetical protein